MALSSFSALASVFSIPIYVPSARTQLAFVNMNTDAIHPTRGASVEDIQSQLRKRTSSYTPNSTTHSTFRLIDQLSAPPSSTLSGALPLITTSSPNSSTIASAPPAPMAPTKSASHFTRDTPSCAIPHLSLPLLDHLTRFLARLLLPRRLRQIQGPPPHFPPHGQPCRTKSRSRLDRQRCRLRHQRRPVVRYRPTWPRRRLGGRESQHCGVGVRERAAERGVGGGLVQFARSEYSVHLCMNPLILFPWGKRSADEQERDGHYSPKSC